jgi:hypothetical protein
MKVVAVFGNQWNKQKLMAKYIRNLYLERVKKPKEGLIKDKKKN